MVAELSEAGKCRLERHLAYNPLVYSAPVFLHTRASPRALRTLLRGRPGTLFIDCGTLLVGGHVYGRIAEALFRIPRDEALCIDSPAALFRCHQGRRPAETGLTVVLAACEELLREDPNVLWTLLNLRHVLPRFEGGLRIVMISSETASEFSAIFGETVPVISIVDRPDTLLTSSPVDWVATRQRPEDIPEAAFTALVQNIYSVTKDQLSDAKMLAAFVARILPTFREVVRSRNIPWNDVARLYQASLKQVTSLVNGESLRALYTSQVSSLNGVERYLLLAGYISAHNNAKHDLKLFSSAGKKARVVRNQGAKKKTIHRDKHLNGSPKAFGIDRLLAIFFFIVSSPVPKLCSVYAAIGSLIDRQLLTRSSGLHRLEAPKLRCPISLDLALLVAKELSFDLIKYLSSST